MQSHFFITKVFNTMLIIPFPINAFQQLLGAPEAFTGQMKYIILQASSWSVLGSPPNWS